jgi:hypothetical protein
MTRKLLNLTAGLLLLMALPNAPALGYEAASTHAGMTERAALHGNQLHLYLTSVHGLALGIFEPMRIDPSRLAYLQRDDFSRAFGALDPVKGYRPSTKNINRALAWLTAGSVVEEIPYSRGRHHFLDPRTGRGLHNAKGRWGLSIRMSILDSIEGGGSFGGLFTGTNFNLNGKSVLTWARHKNNNLSLPRHMIHRLAALTAASPAERHHHLALALLTAGALLHLLQDMAVPAHVRNDFARTYLARRSNIGTDRSSAYEALVRKRYGRAGIPKASGTLPKFARFNEFFKNSQATGLAQRTQRSYFSLGSVPKPVRLSRSMTSQAMHAAVRLALGIPGPPIKGLRLRSAGGAGLYYGTRTNPYLFAYRVTPGGRLEFTLDNRCYRASAKRLVPEAVRYSAGMLAHLLRGRVTVQRQGSRLRALHSGPTLGAGTVVVLWDNAKGGRKRLSSTATAAGLKPGAPLASVDASKVPKNARQVIIAWSGVDAQGEPLVMGGRHKLP